MSRAARWSRGPLSFPAGFWLRAAGGGWPGWTPSPRRRRRHQPHCPRRPGRRRSSRRARLRTRRRQTRGPQPADRLHESARATVELEGTMPYPPDRLWAHGRGRRRTARDRAGSRRAPRVARRSPVGPRRRRHGVQAPAGRAGDFQQRRVQRGAGRAMGAAVFWALPGLAPGAHRRKNGSGLAPGRPRA